MARIELGERVVAVDAPWGALAQALEPKGVLLAGAWDVRTGRASNYRGVTTTVVEGCAWPGPGQASQITFDAVEIRRVVSGRGETVSIAARVVTDRLAGSPR